MTIINEFDSTKYCLGTLCVHKHKWNNTEKSLREVKGSRRCIECRRQNFEKWKKENPEKYKASQQKYWSKPESLAKRAEYNCKYRQRPDYPEMHRRGNNKYAKTEKGKACHQRATKKFYQTHKGKALAREFVKKRRAIKKQVHSTTFTELERQSRFDMFEGMCAYCGEPAKVFDHFIPISKGGTHTLSNLLPSCISCNGQKWKHDPDVWYKSQPFYSVKRWKRILKALNLTEHTLTQLSLF
jgi:5-methylcytosine-specific restriction endonuclease McrA